MKTVNTVRIRKYYRCARCGQEEENPSVTDVALEHPITFDENSSRITAEAIYLPDNDEYAPEEAAECKIIEKKR